MNSFPRLGSWVTTQKKNGKSGDNEWPAEGLAVTYLKKKIRFEKYKGCEVLLVETA